MTQASSDVLVSAAFARAMAVYNAEMNRRVYAAAERLLRTLSLFLTRDASGFEKSNGTAVRVHSLAHAACAHAPPAFWLSSCISQRNAMLPPCSAKISAPAAKNSILPWN